MLDDLTARVSATRMCPGHIDTQRPYPRHCHPEPVPPHVTIITTSARRWPRSQSFESYVSPPFSASLARSSTSSSTSSTLIVLVVSIALAAFIRRRQWNFGPVTFQCRSLGGRRSDLRSESPNDFVVLFLQLDLRFYKCDSAFALNTLQTLHSLVHLPLRSPQSCTPTKPDD